MTVDHEEVMWARLLLLGSRQPSSDELVRAYRVLARVGPRAYAPKLVAALIKRWYEIGDPRTTEGLAAEAVRVARAVEGEAPKGTRDLHWALKVHQKSLYALGRRAEGRATCEELAEAGDVLPLAVVLAEEGRFREAAALEEEAARDLGPGRVYPGSVRLPANLEVAGLHEEAAAAFRALLEAIRSEADEGRTARTALVWVSVHLARMRDSVGDGAGAEAARREALDVLGELAAGAGPRPWAGDPDWWKALFLLSGRAAEPVASPDSPMPSLDAAYPGSHEVKDAFLAALPALEARAAVLREAGRLPELIDVWRRIGVRVAFRDVHRRRPYEEGLAPYFDEGVALARALPGDPARLARALTDRSMFLVAAGSFGPAHADLAEAAGLLRAD
ncbi:hypothetical protein ACN20G_34950 (plasmid) [Streptomyces sp. BI20]|uniref:hypothetical protein n=1 Tax=Streptomyces sp. BI20 TaxID=3403460 RepID=UPI003C765CDD